MTALPFFQPPSYTNPNLPDNEPTYDAHFYLPQRFGGILVMAHLNAPPSWHYFDTVRLTIGRNAVLERIVDAAAEATNLNNLMARTSICFLRSFDIFFPGQGLTTYRQHRTKSLQEVDRVCNEFARINVNSVNAHYQLFLDWTQVEEALTLDFQRWMNLCNRSLASLRSVIEDPVLRQYTDVNAVFSDWWLSRLDEVNRLDNLLRNTNVIVPPTVRNVLTGISRQVPIGERVQVNTEINGANRIVCFLLSKDVELAEDGQVLEEVERRSSGAEISSLLETLTL